MSVTCVICQEHGQAEMAGGHIILGAASGEGQGGIGRQGEKGGSIPTMCTTVP